MAESEDSMSTEEVRDLNSPLNVKKPKKRSIIERELETNLTARVTSPMSGDGFSTSRYGRARRLKTDDVDRKPVIDKSPKTEPLKSPIAYKMHAINSLYKTDPPKFDTSITKQIDTIYQENISLSRFNDTSPSPAKKSPKVYTRKDLIQTKDADDDIILIKNLFSPTKSNSKNFKALDSTEKYNKAVPSSDKYKNQNGFDNTSVVKTLDFDDNNKGKRKKNNKPSSVVSKNELFEIEANCPYQVGDLAWARMGTFPFWPCIVTRDPQSGTFVKKKLFGRVEHNILHVTFFGDNGRRSWIVDNMLRPYNGKQEFETTRDKFTVEDKKRDPRLFAAFFISEKKQSLWNISVEEAEQLMKEPKRLRIDILNDMIHKARDSKKQLKSGKISRTNSDVSLSESLYDSLFSEDDTKTDDQGRLTSRSRNHKSFDVSEVVTACLDNMAAKTGITKIQRQSHMDRWLQKAKSKTPEKPQNKVTVKTERNTRNTRSRNSKTRKGGSKSVTTTDESNLSDQDVKNVKIKTDCSSSEDTTPALQLLEDVTVKMELIDEINDKQDGGKLNDLITNGEIETSKEKVISVEDFKISNDKVEDDQTKTDENVDEANKSNVEEQSQNEKALHEEIKSANEVTKTTQNKEPEMPESPIKEEVPKPPELMESDDTPITESKEDTNSLEDYSNINNDSDKMDVPNKNSENDVDETAESSDRTNINIDQKDSVLPTAETNETVKLSENYEPMEVDISEPRKDTAINIIIPEVMPENAPRSDNIESSPTYTQDYFGEKEPNKNNYINSPEVLPENGKPNETFENSPTYTQNDADEIVEPCIFLGERSGVEKHPEKSDSNQTSNFLDDDHNHLLDRNKNDQESIRNDIFFDKKLKDHMFDNIVAKDLENHECKDVNIEGNIKTNHEMSIDDSGDNILDKINDILNESGESESILQPEPLNLEETSLLNSETENRHGPNDCIETNDIDKDNLNNDEQISNGVNSITKKDAEDVTVKVVDSYKNEPVEGIFEEISKTNQPHAGSSTPKKNDEVTTKQKKTEASNNVPEIEEYEIEDSDDEPSPEYEPLGDDITEDFRQHMKCIENSVTDRKDEKQIVKICDEITKTIKQEVLDSISPNKDLPQSIAESPKKDLTQPIAVSPKKDLPQPIAESPKKDIPPPIAESLKKDIPQPIAENPKKDLPQPITESHKKDLPQPIAESPKENVPKSKDKAANPEYNGMLSPQIKVINESTPPQLSERRARDLRTKDKSSEKRGRLSLNKSLTNKSTEILANELSPQTSVKKETETLNLSKTPHRTRSRTKKFDVSKQENHESKRNHTIGNGDIQENHHENRTSSKHKKAHTQINGSIEEIYSKMCKNEPKVMLTPLKTQSYMKSPATSNSKDGKSPNKFKLSLKKVKSPDSNQNDFYTIVRDEMKRKEPKILPIENGLETTIPVPYQNGYHHRENDKDADFNVDTASVNSDDSDESVILQPPRRSLRTRNLNNKSEHSEFLQYLELRQDYLMDEYPELNEEEIEEYLHRTWEYEESLKCDVTKSDDIRHSNLVKGIKQESPKTPKDKKSNKTKAKPANNTIENYFRDRYQKKKSDIKLEPVVKIEDNLIDSQPTCSNSSDSGIESNKDKNETDNDVKMKTPPKLLVSIDLTDVNNSNVKILSNQIKEEVKDTPLIGEVSTPKRLSSGKPSPKLRKPENEASKLTIKEEKDTIETESLDSDSEVPLRQLRSKVLKEKQSPINSIEVPAITKLKQEIDDVISIDSDDEPLNKHLKKKKTDKKSDNPHEEPDFVKFLELRQDALIDENPQLNHQEIVEYLYKTWLYEESSKSELKKNDEIEQSNLVKGLNQDSVPKKVKRKPRTEKPDKVDKNTKTTNDEVVHKDKPRRKTVQPFYNEEYYSDIEEQLELFEIFRKKAPVKKEVKESGVKDEQTVEIKDETTDLLKSEINNEIDLTNEVEMVDNYVEILDSWENYFADLLKPKPNVFKGLIREKVCEICERTGNLYKCKSCNGMFHPDCLKKDEVIELNTPKHGRNKKKKKPRKNKSLEDSESHDEKSQDSESPQNVSIEELMAEPCTFDAETIESHISAKMQEMLISEELQYDSYSSDDGGIDWTESVPGKCEIIEVKLKPKKPPVDYSNLKCNNCQEYETPLCFVCKKAVSKNDVKMRQKCHNSHCHKYYHLECLDQWPQTQFLSGEPSKNNKKINEFFEALSCPRHVCHTCVSDDPRGCKTRFCGDKLARCVRCPATYHSFTKCLPAGSQILTASQIICPRHYQHRPGKVPCHVNTGWCFICALGGSLICCEYCPTSFHAECLNIKPPEGNYMCEDCETGRLPLYGEMVWVKLGHYRWWPGIILHPSEIPENIMAVKHGLGEFVVRFFGQYDHYWVNRGRVFPYQEGDSGRISTQKTKIDADFTTAMEHAQRAFEILKNSNPNEEESLDIASSLLPPHYVKLKSNKPCGPLVARREDPALSLTQCECDPAEGDPCGPYSQCLNRMLLTECGPTCRAGERCNNRAFEKRLYPKLTPYRTPHRGWGLKTLDDIKAGQFVIEYVGELIDEEEFRRRMRRKHEIRDENFYFLTLDKERMIDAGPKGNLARFMNHCCEPNCETQKWTVLGDIRVGLFAINDIPANSEVTFNYNLECAGIDKKRCMCGARRCAGYIGAKPKQDENHTKKSKDGKLKRTYKKRKPDEQNKTSNNNKQKKPLGRPPKPKELTEIEKDLMIIKSATTPSSGESSTSSRSQSIEEKTSKKRKLDSTDDVVEVKRQKCDDVVEVKRQKCDDVVEVKKQKCDDVVEMKRQKCDDVVEVKKQKCDDVVEVKKQTCDDVGD